MTDLPEGPALADYLDALTAAAVGGDVPMSDAPPIAGYCGGSIADHAPARAWLARKIRETTRPPLRRLPARKAPRLRRTARAGLGRRTAQGDRRTRRTTRASSRGTPSGKPGDDPPSSAQPPRQDDEQETSGTVGPRRRGELVHVREHLIAALERLARLAYARTRRARLRSWWRRLLRRPIPVQRLAVMR